MVPTQFKPLIGTCNFHWSPIEKVSNIKLVRTYIASGWIWTPHGLYIQPMKQAQDQFLGLDDYFFAMKAKGVQVLACINQSPVWLNGFPHWDSSNDYPPIKPGANRLDPASYADYASFWWQITARYGRKKWSADKLRLDPALERWTNDGTQQPKSGLDYLKYVEIGNEWDKWWKLGSPESGQYMTPEELATMLHVVYRAVKDADPSMQVVMPGLTNFNLPYLQKMFEYIDQNGWEWPMDVINVHHYSSLGNLPGVHPPTWKINEACAPEEDKDFESIKGVVQFAKSLKKPVWVTECGYDTTPNSPNAPHSVPWVINEVLQGQWLLRTILLYRSLGVDRVYGFNFNDEPSAENGGQFVSSGLVRNKAHNYQPKVSYYIIVAALQTLHGLNFSKRLNIDGVAALQFGTLSKGVIAYWSPTATGKSFQAKVAGKLVTVNESVQYMATSLNVVAPSKQLPNKS